MYQKAPPLLVPLTLPLFVSPAQVSGLDSPPNSFHSQAHQKRGPQAGGTPNLTHPGLSRKKHENVLSRVGIFMIPPNV